MTAPAFSVVVCFRDARQTLERAIQSLLAQSCSDWELLLVDDASSDGSHAIYSRYAADRRVRIHRHAVRQGIGANKALGGRVATGEHLAILDGDDWLEPEALATVLAAYRADRRRAMVYSTHWRVDGAGQRARAAWVKPYPLWGSSGIGTDVASHMLTFRRREYQLAGGYDERHPCATDKQIIAAMETVTYPCFVDAPLYNYSVPATRPGNAHLWHESVIAKAAAAESGLSIVIPYHKRPGYLRQALESLAVARPRVPFEVVLVCWADDFDAAAYPFVRKIESDDGDAFNLGRLRNAGARQARFRKLFFMDCDIVVPPWLVDGAFERIHYKRAWFPICRDQRLRPGTDAEGWRVHGFGLCGVTKRDLFWSGGWPEFDDWGCEDTLQHFKLRHDGCFILRERVPGLIHLDHPYVGYRSGAHAATKRARLHELQVEYQAASRGG
jgi:glycosyltransferase involved in cell wall biosynthesis